MRNKIIVCKTAVVVLRGCFRKDSVRNKVVGCKTAD